MLRSYKFRVYPTPAQARAMDTILFRCRTLYNAALEQRRTAWGMTSRHRITAAAQMRELPTLKEEVPEFGGIEAQVLQDVIKRLDKSFARFFDARKEGKRAGFPRFKARHRYNSFTYPQARPVGGFKFTNGKLDLRGIGRVRIAVHRRVEGKMKTCIIKRDADRWYAVIVAEMPDPPRPTGMPLNPVGIDLGLTDLVTTSDGMKIGNPRHLVKAEERIKERQRELSRKKKSSKNRRKARVRLARAHRKVRDQRADFHHKLSRTLVERYDAIFVEDLNVAGLMRGRNSRSFADASWSGLVSKLVYKAASAGDHFGRVPAGGTSQDCSSCPRTVPKPLSERTHRCECGAVLDRDHNAARNVLRRGLERLSAVVNTVGPEQPELTPVEMQASTVREDREPASWKQESSEKDATPFRAW